MLAVVEKLIFILLFLFSAIFPSAIFFSAFFPGYFYLPSRTCPTINQPNSNRLVCAKNRQETNRVPTLI